MLSLSPSVRIFACLQPADMRRSFDGLSAMVSQVLMAYPQSGHLFVFRNRRGDRMRIPYWDRDGFALYVELGTKRVIPSLGLCRALAMKTDHAEA